MVALTAAALVILALVLAVVFARPAKPDEDANALLDDTVAQVAARIDELLPQTQCEQCTFPGCRPYATAIARGEAPINRCPPGGQATVDKIARLLGQPTLPVASAPPFEHPVAVIDEDRCIGCVKCIIACPVDAILGASKRMHTVIQSECTGCELCIEPCPVDCIDLIGLAASPRCAMERRA